MNRTADHRGDDRYASWSPDGRLVAFWSDRDGAGYYVMPALGGAPTKVIGTPGAGQFYHSAPEWSADGTVLAAATYTIAGARFEQSVAMVSMITRESAPDDSSVTSLVGKRGTLGVMQPATDGNFLYFPWRDDLGDIWVMDVVQ